MNSILGGQLEHFGLDIGSTGVRIVQLQKGQTHPDLVTYGHVPLPPGLAASDSPADQDQIAGVIRQLVKDAKVTTNQVVVGIPTSQAFTTVITTPKLSPAELAKAMKLQADQYIPMALDQVKMDWQIIGPGKTENEMQVLLVSAPNSVVNKYLTIIQKAGLDLQAIEINAVALVRSLLPNSDIAVLIVDMGYINSDITIVHNRVPKLARSVSVGGEVFVRAVGQTLGLDEAQAEQFTRKFGLTQTKLEGQVLKAMKPSLDNLVSEIDKSIKFFGTQNEGIKIEKVLLTGGTSSLPEMTTYLANATGLSTSLANPWGGVTYPSVLQDKLTSLSLEYAIAIGLAQRSFL